MRTSQANRFARWAAMAAAGLTLVSLLAYGWRQWQAQQARNEAPPVVPQTVKTRSESFSFSKVEGERTLFTIRAAQATEFKAGGQSVLQDVWITIYGKAGKRFDNIHTRACDYQPATGRIVCAGDVQIDLESAEEASARPGQRAIQIRTSRVNFDRETGEARTEQPVEFKFAYGAGRGTGLGYSTREGVARLEKDVEVTLAGTQDPAPARLTGGALEYARDSRTMRLLGPVLATQGTRELRTGALTAEFNAEMMAQRLLASGRPTLRERASGDTSLAAEQIIVAIGRDNAPESVVADGQVVFTAKNSSSDDRITARRVEMDLTDAGRQPRQVRATGAVQVTSQRAAAGPYRQLESESLQLDFARSANSAERRLARAETLSAATLELRQAEEQSRVRAGKMIAEFDGRSEIRRMLGSSGVEVERRIGRRPPQEVSSQEMTLQFDPRGEWTEVEQTGDVRFRDGARSANAQAARAVRSSDTLYLSGPATLADAVSRTTAQAFEINQRTGEALARGGVRTSYLVAAQRPGAAFVPTLAPQPAHITAAELRANAEEGRAVYSGNARLWQGDSVIESETIELRRAAGDERQLFARGNVRALFPQAANGAVAALPNSPSSPKGSSPPRTLWRAQAEQLIYASGAAVIHLEGHVSAESNIGRIQSPRVDFFLSGEGGAGQQLSRAEARGGVTVRQGDRRGTAERADYLTAEGKFILSGGKPTLYDAVLGTITGRQLTFFLADDKILVDSEEGSRTVTRHRVEK